MRWFSSKLLILLIGFAIIQSPVVVEAKQVFTFQKVRDGQYRMYVNGIKSKWLDFRKDTIISAGISCRSMKEKFGVADACNPSKQVFNRDLQNNAYLGQDSKNRDSILFDFSNEFALGMTRASNSPDRIPRPVFDFQRVTDRSFDLYINGIKSRSFDLAAVESSTFTVSKSDLRRVFGITGNLDRVVDREFGNNWSKVGGNYQISASRARMGQFDDTLFYFDQVRKTGFRLYINGRKSKWIDTKKFTSDPFFSISAKTLAARYGLTGSVEDVLKALMGSTLTENGVSVEQYREASGEYAFRFTVDNQLFVKGGTRTVVDSTFIVRRQNMASPS